MSRGQITDPVRCPTCGAWTTPGYYCARCREFVYPDAEVPDEGLPGPLYMRPVTDRERFVVRGCALVALITAAWIVLLLARWYVGLIG